MVRIRLRRAGARNQPTHRIVAAEKEKPRDGRFIEILGDYNPRTEPSTIRVKEDRIYYWLGVGAQPTESVIQILNQIGAMERYERYKAGEDLETLLEESQKAQDERNIDPRTRRDEGQKKPQAEAKETEEEVEKPAPEAEAEEEVEAAEEEEEAEETEADEEDEEEEEDE